MQIACHYPIPRPPVPRLDAAVQDGMQLVAAVGGEINFLYPGEKARRIVPRFLCGFHQLSYLRRLDRCMDLHHIFSNGLYLYPVLFFLKKPIVYTSVIEIDRKSLGVTRVLGRRVERFIVGSQRERDMLAAHGLAGEVIPPGIPIDGFTHTPLSVSDTFVLLAGSAPWNEEQFETKGVRVLLQAAIALPWLHLVFLWRGKFFEKMQGMIREHGVQKQVTLINKRVDVNGVLATVHGAVVLAEKSQLVKGFPHSLLESLAAGKPVVLSRCLEMAEYVRLHQCGICVDSLHREDLVGRLMELRKNYDTLAGAAASLDLDCFSQQGMIEAYQRVYRQITGRP